MEFDIKREFEKLAENGWLTGDEIEEYLNDEKIIDSINLCTSPAKENIFNALKLVSFNSVKVVILGQDPYPNPNHAHGLAFSSKDTNTPESLKNIFRAIDSIYNTNLFNEGCNDLTNWAKQGVLLLNTGLTFQKVDDKNSDKKEKEKLQAKIQKNHLKVWRPFIQKIIEKILSIKNRPVVMMLWGNSAHETVFKNIKSKEFLSALHDRNPHIVPDSSVMLLQTSHPSPLSVNRGGDFPIAMKQHLIECEKYLKEDKINWTNLERNDNLPLQKTLLLQ